jgi:transaldolase
MKDNALKEVAALGQSIWLDYIRRDLIVSGELSRLIEEDGLRGMTSNPAIFEKSIVDSHDYDEDIRAMALKGKGAVAIYENLSQRDVQSAADKFRPLYDRTDGKEGYVSLEVNPHLAHDTTGTVEEARRLWAALDRPNVMIKVPATAEGLPAIEQLIREGISINVTYIESLIGPDTVNTVPVETLDAYRDHGDPKARLEQDVERAGSVMEQLSELGVSIDKVTQQLEDEGVEKFNKPFDKLMETLTVN